MTSLEAPPRLLVGNLGRPRTLVEHEQLFGPMTSPGDLLAMLDSSGLRGRGGAGFPTGKKVALIAGERHRHKYVVVNAMEGEPAAHKDRTLLSMNPHLVLDGAEALAHLVGAHEIAVCVARESSKAIDHVERAINERARRGRHHVNVELHTPPGRYIAGEESALVHWLDDNETLPQYRPARPTILRIGRGPVLVDNAETHANVALIARRGPQWFRNLGTLEHPGTNMVSITGGVDRPVVTEVALGTPIRDILAIAGVTQTPRALLLGGYGGTWIDGRHVDTPYDNESLAPIGASVGAGVIVVLPAHSCGIAETSNIARWMANESARQCGPCAFGLPAMASNLADLTSGRGRGTSVIELRERASVIAGRGACRHPDGVIRMVQSALTVFGDDLAEHAKGRPCAMAAHSRFVSVPRLEREDELVWE